MTLVSSLLHRFPNIELSYDTMLHKKVGSDLFMAIPKGIKAFAWFTYEYDKNVCYLLHINKYNKIIKSQKYLACFSNDLAFGTVFFGTLFESDKQTYFTCENIYYYKGQCVRNYTYEKKMVVFKTIFNEHLKQLAYTNDFIYFGMPIISDSFDTLIQQWHTITYPVYCILFLRMSKNYPIGKYIVKPEELYYEGIFKIKAQIYADIYDLYCENNNKEHCLGIAMIPDYKTSVFMNTIFRTIKENHNLDLLEESDSEEDFENISPDKYTNTDKEIIMKCVYMHRFQKWKPIEIMPEITKLSNKKVIIF
jgi:hypothetical protein